MILGADWRLMSLKNELKLGEFVPRENPANV